MRRGASTLRGVDAGDDRRLAQQLTAHASRLLLRLPYPLPPRHAAPPVRGRVSAAAAAPAKATTAPADVVRSTAVRPLPAAVPSEGGGLAASWSTLEELIAGRGLAHGTLEEFLTRPTPLRVTAVTPSRPAAAVPSAAPPAARPVVPIESLAPDESGVVPIESLLYDTATARGRLREVQEELDAELATAGAPPRVRALLGEVFDLIALGFHAPR